MQLTFLGKTYSASSPAIAAIATPETARFLGRSYARKQYTITHGQPSYEAMSYRGVRYYA